MKHISTTVKTGDVVMINGRECKIGQYKHGKISLHYKISEFSGITEQVSTKKLNQLLTEIK